MRETRPGSGGNDPQDMQQDGEAVEAPRPAAPVLSTFPSPRGQRSGEGMHSVLEHLREHLRRKDSEQIRDDPPPPA